MRTFDLMTSVLERVLWMAAGAAIVLVLGILAWLVMLGLPS